VVGISPRPSMQRPINPWEYRHLRAIHTEVPIIPSLPGAADVSVGHLSSSFGPEGLTYYRLLAGREVAFKPRGVTVPSSCPHGGYPFAGEFTFQDGTHLTAHSTAPCASPGKAWRRAR
jgi:hypothetical protein